MIRKYGNWKRNIGMYCRAGLLFPGRPHRIRAFVLLERMVRCERKKKACEPEQARALTLAMRDRKSRRDLHAAGLALIHRYPGSLLLTYIQAVAAAEENRFQEAYDTVDQAFVRTGQLPDCPDLDFLEQLDGIWKAVDRMGFRAMQWPGGRCPAPAVDKIMEKAGRPIGRERIRLTMVGARRLLENRRLGEYLQLCRQALQAADTLSDRLKTISRMTIGPIRRMPGYHAGYALARTSYQAIRPELTALAEGTSAREPAGRRESKKAISALLLGIRVSRTLGAGDEHLLARRVVDLTQKPEGQGFRCRAAAELSRISGEEFRKAADRLVLEAKHPPRSQKEIGAFFHWALVRNHFSAAHDFFAALPDKNRYSPAVLPYIDICEKDCLFARGRDIALELATRAAQEPHAFRPFEYWKLSHDRVGELAFFEETTQWISRVAQPGSPKGVVFLTASDFKKLRWAPFVLLMELKRQGWAVVPLVQGLLPFSPTGDPEIDRFAACIDHRGEITQEGRERLPEIPALEGELDAGTLSWNGLDLSHALWEEAAILKRRYSVDFTCPDLQHRLHAVKTWVGSYLRVLNAIRGTFAPRNLRAAFLTQFFNRLPGAAIRHYCREYGDQDTFYCLGCSNGYDNYSQNFKTQTAATCLVRNMTAFSHMRTTGLLAPEEFRAWYSRDQHRAKDMLAQVEHLTKLKRLSSGHQHMAPGARECAVRIDKWRRAGGRVACLFGKVVCDLSVPFEGGPVHTDMRHWLNHTITAVRGSNTLLLIKPHPHELRNEVGQFLSEHFQDLIHVDLPNNAVLLGHNWFSLHDLKDKVDMGIVYNGTSAVELGLLGIPALLCAHFAPGDYPVGHQVPQSRKHYERLVRFEEEPQVDPELQLKSAAWIHYLVHGQIALPYRYHFRQVTNRVVYPPWWFREDIERYLREGDPNVTMLAARATGRGLEK